MDTTPQVAPAAPAASAPAQDVTTPPSGAGQAPASQATPPAEPPKDPPVTKHSRIQARIDDITRQRYEEQRAREAAEAKLAEYERQSKQREQFTSLDNEMPDIARYNDLASYNRDMALWAAKLANAMTTAEWEKRQQETSAREREHMQRAAMEQAQQAQLNAVIEQRMDVGRKKYPDFVEAISNPELPPIRQHPFLLPALLECQNAHDIAYALAKNPAEYERLYQMRNPWQVARELQALDTKFSGSTATTQAPPPPPPRNGTATGHKDWNDMSTAEHAKAYWARKQRT